jgi:membrane protein
MGLMDRARDRLRRARDRFPVLDHAVRAYDRHSEVLGNQIAGAITYFGFLSFFPLLALAFSAVGYVSSIYPGAPAAITSAVEQAFPSLIGSGPSQINIQDVVDAKAGAGLLGILGLLYAGLGWLDNVREGLRRVFGTLGEPLPLLRKKLVDIAVLLMLGLALLLSIAVSSLATRFTTYVLDQVGLADSLVATGLLKVLAVVLALGVDTVLFAILLSRLSGVHLPWRQVRSGALFAAVGFEVLKLLGTFLIAKTTSNPMYATFGVVVGLLVWINFVSRLLVYAAAWTATQPYSLEPASIGEDGSGRSTAIAAGSEPVRAVAPADYEPVPVGADVGAGRSSRRTLTVRGALVGAVVGAGLAGAVTRRESRG